MVLTEEGQKLGKKENSRHQQRERRRGEDQANKLGKTFLNSRNLFSRQHLRASKIIFKKQLLPNNYLRLEIRKTFPRQLHTQNRSKRDTKIPRPPWQPRWSFLGNKNLRGLLEASLLLLTPLFSFSCAHCQGAGEEVRASRHLEPGPAPVCLRPRKRTPPGKNSNKKATRAVSSTYWALNRARAILGASCPLCPLWQPYLIDADPIPILQMNKLRQRKDKSCAQGHLRCPCFSHCTKNANWNLSASVRLLEGWGRRGPWVREGKELKGIQPCSVPDFVLSTRQSQENKSKLQTCHPNVQRCDGT